MVQIWALKSLNNLPSYKKVFKYDVELDAERLKLLPIFDIPTNQCDQVML